MVFRVPLRATPFRAVVAALFLATASTVVVGGTPRMPVPIDQDANAAAQAVVDSVLTPAEHPAIQWSEIGDVAEPLRALYLAETDRLLWFEGETPLPGLADVLTVLAAAAERGLEPDDYDPAYLSDQWAVQQAGTLSAPDRALFDLAVSVAVARMLTAVHAGRVDPAVMHWGYDISPRRVDIVGTVNAVRQGRPLGATLDSLEPPFAHYARAKRTLADYRARAAAGEPDPVPELPGGRGPLRPGDSWDGVPVLVARLKVLGDLPATFAPGADPTVYAEPIAAAVRQFQDRHVLDVDGVIGPATRRALNVTLEERVRQIELALERERWLPTLSDRPNVFVNVSIFRLWATDPASGDEPLRMRVIVGQSLNHQTPLFVEQMEYVVLRPYWNPPRGITVRELVPRERREPGYFERQNLEIVASGSETAQALPPTEENLAAVVAGRLYLRQRPGPNNSLGLAKFIFPNDDNVYMHGTPAQELFSRTRRDFSHGCIRLEDPARFAEWVLRNQSEWTRERIDAAMQGTRPTQVNLPEPLTVVLFYNTVHVNSEGVVFFAEDIYGHDEALDAALRHGYPYPTGR